MHLHSLNGILNVLCAEFAELVHDMCKNGKWKHNFAIPCASLDYWLFAKNVTKGLLLRPATKFASRKLKICLQG